MQPGHLPFSWRDSHLIHEVTVPEGAGRWWVDMEDQATLDALSLGPAESFKSFTGREEIDRAAAYSNDRNVTSGLAQWLRGISLDDGSEPVGVKFRSRVDNGFCWAYWMRRADLGLTELVKATPGLEIMAREQALDAVTGAWDIRTW